ncbi:MAG: MltA domain-containing protein [Bacteriovoracaceae bacterium]|nr:MltA domain-containing protein [Bacteriovoracaceae bacterium]
MMFPIFLLALMLGPQSFANDNLLVTPTELVQQSISFNDDLEYKNLLLAIERQKAYFARAPLKGKIKFGNDTYDRDILGKSLNQLEFMIRKYILCVESMRGFNLPFGTEKTYCQKEFSKAVNQKFKIYKPQEDIQRREDISGPGRALFTAYYSPDFNGSLTKTETFKNPIYSLPTDPALKKLTRKEIDFQNKLDGKNLELFYVEESLFDLYLLSVEGGGRVKVGEDYHYISYAGANGHPFKFLYHYLIDNGLLPMNQAGLEEQRQYLETNPHQQEAVYSSNPSYIFFKITLDEPMGVGSIPLTSERSLALDSKIYSQPGLLNFVVSKKPYLDEAGKVRYKNFSRFFLGQDTGGAIKGRARADLYMGFGREAQIQANNMKYYGEQYFLVSKE